jgi:NADP-dependent 3-hydroxy acid dehydrogenase YdfG
VSWAGKRYWLVGASAGLGRALAHRLSRAGVELILSARGEDDLRTLADELPGRTHVVPMDVSDPESVAAAVKAAGEIDGLVWTVGLYWPQKAQDWVPKEVEAMCDVNFTGLARVLGRVVPGMVARDAGHIVITGSLSAYRGLPGATGYAASKSGVVHMTESLQMDLRDTGVRVQLANPGFIRTRLTDKNDFKMPFLMEPEEAAGVVWEHMNTDSFRRDFPTAFSWVFRLGNLLPDALYFRLFG